MRTKINRGKQGWSYAALCKAYETESFASLIAESVNETVIKITVPAWGIVEETGYQPCTTLWQDFSIADKLGTQAIKGTFHKSFPWAKKGYKEVTELCLVLNHKIWQHYKCNGPLAELYNELWEKVDAWCGDNLKGEELDYFYQTTD